MMPTLMGIVNVTPDSFSDGGAYFTPDQAIAHGKALIKEGAKILDIGGESTRPNAHNVSVEEEIRRVLPVIRGLADSGVCLSVDTRNAATMAAAIEAGAGMINDVSALTHDPEAVAVAAQGGVLVCLMHMQGTPQTMQEAPYYDHVVDDVRAYLEKRMTASIKGGVREENIILDVGIGFGKTLEHNLLLLRHIEVFKSLGRPLLLGCSRKSFIGALSVGEPPEERISGSIAAALWAMERGVEIFRVHDVAQTAQAFKVSQAIKGALS